MSKRAASKIGNIDDFQNKGYKDSTFAIAEIIDNSIQANATLVNIIIINNTEIANIIDEILIVDNGDGMDRATFEEALVENSGSRSGARKGLGKYGQGLPNASASQTKRVEVYTIQKGKILYNYKDLAEMAKKGDGFLPDIEDRKIVDIEVLTKIKYDFGAHGTIVRWVQPNKLNPKKKRALSEHIEKHIGRIYRYFLTGFTEGKKSIKCDIQLLIYDHNSKTYSLDKLLSKKIKPFDPLFLLNNTQMNDLFASNTHPTSQRLDIPGGKIVKEFDVELEENGIIKVEKTTVELSFSHVKAVERFRHGRNAGDTQFGKIYLYRNLLNKHAYCNISIVRENREIDSGQYGFLTDVSKQTNRWWSAEIKVEPLIDRIIGIDSKKQFAGSIKYLDSVDDSSDEHEIIKWISSQVKANIKTLESIIEKQGQATPPTGDGDKPTGEPIGPTEPGPIDSEEHKEPTSQERKELYEWIKKRFPELSDKEILAKVDWAFSIRDKYIFVNSDLGDTMLYSFTQYGSIVLIEVNINHKFYEKFMESIDNEPIKLRSIRLLMCSFVEAELSNSSEDSNVKRFLRNYKNRMFTTLDDYIGDLYNN